MKINIFRALFWILLLAILSTGVIYFFNQTALTNASNPVKVISSDNYTDVIKNNIDFEDVIEITGTPNLLNQVSQESLAQDNRSDKKIDYYYVGLKEYGFDFVVKVKPGKLIAEKQNFKGRVVSLVQGEFGSRIKNSLNKPISFEDSVNSEAANELDAESKTQIADRSVATFTNSTFLLLDGENEDSSQVVLNIAFWAIILTVFLATLLRKWVFGLR